MLVKISSCSFVFLKSFWLSCMRCKSLIRFNYKSRKESFLLDKISSSNVDN
jgi:hypothetical protein